MPGNHRSGRPATPAEFHVLHGTFRKDRHAKSASPTIAGQVRMPHALQGEARKLWQAVIRPLATLGVVKPGDVAAATRRCLQ